jgi:hypothetical protein
MFLQLPLVSLFCKYFCQFIELAPRNNCQPLLLIMRYYDIFVPSLGGTVLHKAIQLQGETVIMRYDIIEGRMKRLKRCSHPKVKSLCVSYRLLIISHQ